MVSWKSGIFPKGLSNLNTYWRQQINWGLVIFWEVSFFWLFNFLYYSYMKLIRNLVFFWEIGFFWRLAFHFGIKGNWNSGPVSCASCTSGLAITVSYNSWARHTQMNTWYGIVWYGTTSYLLILWFVMVIRSNHWSTLIPNGPVQLKFCLHW